MNYHASKEHMASLRLMIAKIELLPQRPKILGPPALLGELRLARGNNEGIMEILKDWGVLCSETNIFVPIAGIKYYNVERNEVYVSAEVMLNRHQYIINN